MEMLRLLANDHQQTDRLLKQLQAARENAEQRWLFIELKHKLEIHARIEEEIFYPALRDSQGLGNRLDESIADHESVRTLLMQMEETVPGSSRWVESLKELMRKVEKHVQEEESELFPKARSSLAPELQEDLFERMLIRKAELAGGGAESAWRGAQGAKADSTTRTSEQAQEYSRRMGQQGAAAVEQGAGIAADQTRRVAEALHATSENLAKEDQEGLSYYLREAANGLNRFSNRLTQGDVESLLREARDTAKRNPALLLGGAIVAGFLLTRFVKSTETSSTEVPSPKMRTDPGASPRAPIGAPLPSGPTPTSQPSPSHPQEAH